ncbi:AraC family transcriptional regulator [Aeromicrobium massiliense]|uniref:AraC family transcriptional regulator n=1 Tax=Aeromicrobium massiliense TaxID=1464554 RepID=UPI00031F6EC6|nr:helix-turn-helix transcriptional regulator [Aeromicrobium massiliense]
MVEVRQIADVGYAPPPSVATALEAISLSALRQRAGGAIPAGAQRLDFHVLLAVTSGRSTHMVDFETVELEPGTVLWIRPGQVHGWGDMDAFEAHVVMGARDALDTVREVSAWVSDPFAPVRWQLRTSDPAFRAVAEIGRYDDAGLDTAAGDAVLRWQAATAALLLAASGGAEVGAHPELFTAFRRLVEARFDRERDVRAYARELAVTPRTLERAVTVAVATTPKRVVDRRVALEARRLLAHSDASVAAVAARLSFDDAANFSRFFVRVTGELPGAFRERVRGAETGGSWTREETAARPG